MQQSKNLNLVLFYLKSDWQLNIKKVEYIPSFPTGIYFPSSDQWFMRYYFLPDDGLLKTVILDRLQWWKEIKIWGYSGGILSLSWIPKSWKTLQDFHQLLIQAHRTNGSEVMEFCALTNF
jgi:hypothetical protein